MTRRAAHAFSSTSEYLTWVVSVEGMIAVWALVGLASAGPYVAVRAPLTTGRRAPVVAAIVLASAVLATQLLVSVDEPPFFSPLPNHKLRLAILTLLAEAAALPAVVGMWSVLAALGQQSENPPASSWSEGHARSLEQLLSFRSHLQVFLGAGGVVIGSTTLSIGALRNAMVVEEVGYDIPVAHVLLYGIVMTLLLAIMYVPVDLALAKAERALVDRVRPVPTEAFPDDAWAADRARLAGLLQLEKRPLDSFRRLLAVFAPFIGSLAGVLIPLTK